MLAVVLAFNFQTLEGVRLGYAHRARAPHFRLHTLIVRSCYDTQGNILIAAENESIESSYPDPISTYVCLSVQRDNLRS